MAIIKKGKNRTAIKKAIRTCIPPDSKRIMVDVSWVIIIPIIKTHPKRVFI
jgi:hypothetical protein